MRVPVVGEGGIVIIVLTPNLRLLYEGVPELTIVLRFGNALDFFRAGDNLVRLRYDILGDKLRN